MAANEYVNVYSGNPTAGGTDGTRTENITVELDASRNESVIVKLAVRAETGYNAKAGSTVVTVSGATTAKWGLSLTENGTFTSSLTFPDAITTTNTIFYAKVTATSDERPLNDTTVTLPVTAKIKAV